MTRHKKDHEHEGEGGTKTYDTFYEDDASGSGSSWNFNPAGAVCGIIGGLRDSVLKTLPVEVTEHLVNGEKELIKAGIAMAESQMRSADDMLHRARDLKKDKAAD